MRKIQKLKDQSYRNSFSYNVYPYFLINKEIKEV